MNNVTVVKQSWVVFARSQTSTCSYYCPGQSNWGESRCDRIKCLQGKIYKWHVAKPVGLLHSLQISTIVLCKLNSTQNNVLKPTSVTNPQLEPPDVMWLVEQQRSRDQFYTWSCSENIITVLKFKGSSINNVNKSMTTKSTTVPIPQSFLHIVACNAAVKLMRSWEKRGRVSGFRWRIPLKGYSTVSELVFHTRP